MADIKRQRKSKCRGIPSRNGNRSVDPDIRGKPERGKLMALRKTKRNYSEYEVEFDSTRP